MRADNTLIVPMSGGYEDTLALDVGRRVDSKGVMVG